MGNGLELMVWLDLTEEPALLCAIAGLILKCTLHVFTLWDKNSCSSQLVP